MADAARSVEFTYEEGVDLPSVATQRAMNLLRTRSSPPQKEPRPLSVTTSLGAGSRASWPRIAATCGPVRPHSVAGSPVRTLRGMAE